MPSTGKALISIYRTRERKRQLGFRESNFRTCVFNNQAGCLLTIRLDNRTSIVESLIGKLSQE